MNAKKINVAEAMEEKVRRRYYSLYPNSFSFYLRTLTTQEGGYEWQDGLLVSTDNTLDGASQQLTDAGWTSLQNAGIGRVPATWPGPHKDAPLFCIPEDAHEDWLSECSGLVGDVMKINTELYRQHCVLRQRMGGGTQASQDCAIERSWRAFMQCRDMIAKQLIAERIDRIRTARLWAGRPPLPPEVKAGVLVRVRGKEPTARVVTVLKARTGLYVQHICVLDKEIDGLEHWDKNLLEPIPE